MHALALAALLAATAAAPTGLQRTKIRPSGGLSKLFPSQAVDPASTRFAPASGAGLQTTSELCDVAGTHLTGSNAFCLKSDGTSHASGLTLSAVGAPTAQPLTTCPNGIDCSTTPGMRVDGTDDAYRTTATPSSPTGDFTACWFGQVDAVGTHVMGKEAALAARGFEFATTGGAVSSFIYTAADGSANCQVTGAAAGVVAGANQLLCVVYDFVTDGTSTFKAYVDGAQSGATTSGCSGPMATNTTDWFVGARHNTFFAGWTAGRVRGAFVTETALSAAQVAAIARGVLADMPTGSKGQALTFTRSSAKFCADSTGAGGSWLTVNRPCLTNGGIHVEEASTNLAIRNQDFSHAAWTASSVTVTANTLTAPDGTLSADTLAGSGAGGYVESTAAAITGSNGTVSVYVRATSGTQAMAIRLRDTTAAADRCTGTLTATTTWQRVSCTSTGLTTTNDHVVRVFPGGVAGTGTVVAWGAQQEAATTVSSLITTAGTSASRSADNANLPAQPSLATPLSVSVKVVAPINTTDGYIWDNRNGSGHGLTLLFGGANALQLYATDGTNAGQSDSAALTWTSGVTYRVAVAKSGTDLTMYRDGSSVGTPTGTPAATLPATGVFWLGRNSAGSQFVNGVVKDVCIAATATGCAP